MKKISLFLITFFGFQTLHAQVLEKSIDKLSSLKNADYKVIFHELLFEKETTDTLLSQIEMYPGDTSKAPYYKIAYNYILTYDGKNMITQSQKDSTYSVFDIKGKDIYRGQYERSLLTYMPIEYAKYLKTPQKITYLKDTLINRKKYSHLLLVAQKDSVIEGKLTYSYTDVVIDQTSYLPYRIKYDALFLINGQLNHFIEDYYYSDYKLNQENFPDLSVVNIPTYFVNADEKYKAHNDSVANAVPLQNGTLAPNFELKDIDGKTVNLKNINNNKMVLVDFTSISCPHCYEAIGLLKKIRAKYSRAQLEIVEVYDNSRFSPKKDVLNVVKKYNTHDFITLLNGENVAKAYHYKGLPHFYLIDKNGKVLENYLGAMPDLDTQVINKISGITQ